MKNKLERIIKDSLLLSNGWLVGNAIGDILDGKTPKDYDIIVPDRELFQNTCAFLFNIFGRPRINSCGGLKYRSESMEIDIWCEELGHFLMNANSIKYLYNGKRNISLKNEQ